MKTYYVIDSSNSILYTSSDFQDALAIVDKFEKTGQWVNMIDENGESQLLPFN